MTGEVDPDTVVTLATTIAIAGIGTTVEYCRRAWPDDGTFAVVLALPGEYEIGGSGGTLTVAEDDVREGAELTL